jgi:hypothetical protein
MMNKLNKSSDINNFNDYFNYNMLKEKMETSAEILKYSNVDFVIQTLEDLPKIIENINNNNFYDEYHRIKMYQSR